MTNAQILTAVLLKWGEPVIPLMMGKVLNGIAFNMSDRFDYIKSGKPFDICYTIEENKHANKSNYYQLFVKEIHTYE